MPGQSKYSLGKSSARIELKLPSGHTCLVVRPGVQGLIKARLLDSLDQLTTIVQADHIDANNPKAMASAVSALSADPKRLLEAMELMDKVMCHVVVDPKVLMPPSEEDERDEDKLYADEVDEEDKMFIFQFVVGGTRDIATFRAESAKLLGRFPTSQDISLSS